MRTPKKPKLFFGNWISLEKIGFYWVFSPQNQQEEIYMLAEAYKDNELFESNRELDLINRYEYRVRY